MMHKHFLYIIAVAAVLCSACSGKKSQDGESRAVAVSVVTVGDSRAAAGSEYVGQVVERTGVSLSFEVPGRVSSLRADNGDRVARGQLLGTVDPATLRDAHAMALATLRQAQDAYRRFEPLHRQGVVSDIKWVEVQTALEQAQSAESLSRTQLSRTKLVAPFAGVISGRTAECGQNVLAGQQVLRLVDISRVDVSMSVPENEVSSISVGAKARVTVSALGGRAYDASVTEKGVEANPVSHTYDIKLAISNTDGRLMPGMVCNVRMSAAAGPQAAQGGAELSVPLGAVKLDSDNRRFVWIADGGKARQQFVTLGQFTDGGGVVVTSGLQPGDRVITDGSQKVSQGMRLEIRK